MFVLDFNKREMFINTINKIFNYTPAHGESLSKLLSESSKLNFSFLSDYSDVGLIQSHVGTGKPDVRNGKSDVRTVKPDVRNWKSDVRIPKSDVRFSKSDVRNRKPDVRISKPDVRISKSDVRNSKSDVRIPKSDVRFSKSDVRNRKPDVRKVQNQAILAILTKNHCATAKAKAARGQILTNPFNNDYYSKFRLR